jgi:hypothetical protein
VKSAEENQKKAAEEAAGLTGTQVLAPLQEELQEEEEVSGGGGFGREMW